MRPFHATTTPSRSWRALSPFLMAVALLCLGDAAQAQAAAGTVTHLSGLLTARRDDGSTRLLAARSVVHEGETLVTGADTYMEVQFLDDATLTMGPDSQVQVTQYSWNPDAPTADRVLLELQRGVLRSETGRLGKRNHEAIRIKVPGGEIGVHGTTFLAQSVPTGPTPAARPTSPPASSATQPASNSLLSSCRRILECSSRHRLPSVHFRIAVRRRTSRVAWTAWCAEDEVAPEGGVGVTRELTSDVLQLHQDLPGTTFNVARLPGRRRTLLLTFRQSHRGTCR
jgi:hypothetical protein